jgi:hypothetical protein
MNICSYFVPEDGDIESEPNVFLAPKPRHPGAPPAFGQVRDSFPLPGQYHFRFKSALIPGSDRDKSAMPVWMDFAEERQPVPTWMGSIVAKVTRINMDDDDDDDDDDDFPSHVPASSAAAPTPVPVPQQQRAPSHSHASSVGSSVGSIDDLFGTPAPASSVPAAPSTADTAGSLLDFNDGGAPAPSHHHHQQQQQQPQQNKSFNDTVSMKILKKFPRGSLKAVKKTKRLALHLAVETKMPMSLIAALIKTNPKSLNTPDPVTKLWPYVLAIVDNDKSLSVSYALLRADPSVLQLAKSVQQRSNNLTGPILADDREYDNDHSLRRTVRRLTIRDNV